MYTFFLGWVDDLLLQKLHASHEPATFISEIRKRSTLIFSSSLGKCTFAFEQTKNVLLLLVNNKHDIEHLSFYILQVLILSILLNFIKMNNELEVRVKRSQKRKLTSTLLLMVSVWSANLGDLFLIGICRNVSFFDQITTFCFWFMFLFRSF